ncbi:MAG: hypothetical protein ACHQ51_11855 [Elusimicrobiota bacterium]
MTDSHSNGPWGFLKKPSVVAGLVAAAGALFLAPIIPYDAPADLTLTEGPVLPGIPSSPAPTRPQAAPAGRISVAQAFGRAMGFGAARPAPIPAVNALAPLAKPVVSAPPDHSSLKARAAQQFNKLLSKFAASSGGGGAPGAANSQPAGSRAGRTQSTQIFAARGDGSDARAIGSVGASSSKVKSIGGDPAVAYNISTDGVGGGVQSSGGPIGIKDTKSPGAGGTVAQSPPPTNAYPVHGADGGPMPASPTIVPTAGPAAPAGGTGVPPASAPPTSAPSLDAAKAYVSNYSTGPWTTPNGTVCSSLKVYSRTTGVDQAHPPKGCASPAASNSCLNAANHRDFLPAEWVDATTIQTIVNGSDYPLGKYDYYLSLSATNVKKIGTISLVSCTPTPASSGCQWTSHQAVIGPCTSNYPPDSACNPRTANSTATGPTCGGGVVVQETCVCPGGPQPAAPPPPPQGAYGAPVQTGTGFAWSFIAPKGEPVDVGRGCEVGQDYNYAVAGASTMKLCSEVNAADDYGTGKPAMCPAVAVTNYTQYCR